VPRSRGLTEIDQLTLLAIARIGEGAYGVTIRREIDGHGRRSISLASVYEALDRLERRGYTIHHLSPPTPERGGRAKKLFRITATGRDAVLESREVMDRMWDGLKLAAGRGS